ncbi:conjugative transfer system coupling protein TraD [Vibrio rumoiensis]|uniref:conjugative transfer system coupling protein TraD n=1 Tax=Vibrio rumoiensis TaxID=76258 RepID=UPI00374A4E1B
MSTERLLDGTLRPTYEFYTIITTSVCMLLIWLFSQYLFLDTLEKVIVLTLGGTLVSFRVIDAVRLKRYQMSLNNIDPFFLATDEIRHSQDKTWIGRGFNWSNHHSQRVWDANKENLKKFYKLPWIYHWFRANEMAVELADGKAARTQKLEKEFINPEHQVRINPKNVKVSALSRAIAKKTKSNTWMFGHIKNPYKPIPPVGGVAAYHAVGLDEEEDQYITLDERNGHLIVFGQSRVGKTRLLEILVSQDIERNDSCVGVFDPKTDAELIARMWAEAKRAGRDDNFYIFNLGAPDISCRYSAIASFSRIASVAGRISENMSGGGDGQVFKDFAWRFLLLVAQSLVDMGEKPTFRTMKQHVEDLEPLFLRYAKFIMKRDNPSFEADWVEIQKPKFRVNNKGEEIEVKLPVGALKGRSKETVAMDHLLTDFYERNPRKINQALEGLRSAMKNDVSYYNKITASLIPLLTKLTTGRTGELLNPDYMDMFDNRPIFSWKKVIQSKSVFYCGFDALSDDVLAQATARMFFSDLVSEAGEIYKYGMNKGLPDSKSGEMVPIWLHCDEFQSLINNDMVPILNRSAGAGIRISAYTQVISDIEQACDGNAAQARVILGNFNSVIMMRVATKDTAEYLTDKLSTVDYWGLDVQGGVSDSGKILTEDDEETGQVGSNMFSTRTTAGVKVEAHEPVITPNTIMSLSKGQAFAYLNGQRLVKLRFPLLQDAPGYKTQSLEGVYKDYAARLNFDEFKTQYVA